MTTTQTRIIRRLSIFVLLFASVSIARAQQVAITAPANGTVYTPGSTINVTAAVSGGSVLAVKIAAQDIGTSPFQRTAPYSFSFAVPTGVVGRRNVFAAGLIADETAVFSPMITVDIEPGTAPTSISFQQPLVAFGYVGEQQKIGVTATFADGSTLDVSKSTQLSFTSGNTTLVSVDATGLITGLGPGNATVTAAFGGATATLQTVGPTTVKGDLDGDGLVTLDDLLFLESMVGQPPTGPNDARDLNGDGKIDYLDVQALLTACGSNCPSLGSTTTSLAASASHVQYTRPMTFTGTVTGNSPTGTVSFLVDGQLANTGILGTNGQASVVTNSLSVGSHTVNALFDGDASNGPSASAPVSVTITAVPGDVNGDGAVNCLDLALVKASFGKKTGQPGFNPNADVNHDGVVNVLDLSFVARQVPAGTTCP
jgi:hypothetical protein